MKLLAYFFILSFFSINIYAQEKKAADLPYSVQNAFLNRFYEGKIGTWKFDDSNYLINFTDESEGMEGTVEYTPDTVWVFTKYAIPEKELPGPAMTDIKTNYFGFKIKISELVQQPDSSDYYHVYAKKEGLGQPSVDLYYSLLGKLTRKELHDVKTTEENTEVNENNSNTTEDNEIKNTTETISTKELPSKVAPYIKKNYPGYIIKEATLSITDEGTLYFVKIKKEQKKAITEVTFDKDGKFIEDNTKKDEEKKEE
jgi:hypothetical protein